MKKYHRLTREERYQIEAWLRSGLSIRAISRHLRRSPSTISREVSRCGETYEALRADKESRSWRERPRRDLRKLQGSLEQRVRSRLREDWSPEQIACVFKKISYVTIYRYIEREENRDLKKHLRILRRQEKDRKKPNYYRKANSIKNKQSIETRPPEVELRNRVGDYERDTLYGVAEGRMLLSIVDRTSRLVKLALIEKKSADLIDRATIRCLRNEPVYTITNDNGPEFAFHERTARKLRAKIYFSRAYRSWERGTNENTNGLIRQYFPRRKEIPKISSQALKAIEKRLNSRPRKCLGFKTPSQVHAQMKKRQVLR